MLLFVLSRMWTTPDPNTHLQWHEGQLLPMGLLARCFLETPGNVYHGLIHH